MVKPRSKTEGQGEKRQWWVDSPTYSEEEEEEEEYEELDDSSRKRKRFRYTSLVKKSALVEGNVVLEMSVTNKQRKVEVSSIGDEASYMTESRARSMVDFSHEREFDEEEVLDAVALVRDLLDEYGDSIGYDCAVCYRALDNHNDERCEAGDKESGDDYIMRQFSRLASGLRMLDENRKGDRQRELSKEVEALKNALADKRTGRS